MKEKKKSEQKNYSEKNQNISKNLNKDNKEERSLPGYKPYPEDEDIYSKDKETDIDPEKLAEAPEKEDVDKREELSKASRPNDTLDVPGAELDDEAEDTGAEDEENNYYSLGGDNHENLEEDNSTKQ